MRVSILMALLLMVGPAAAQTPATPLDSFVASHALSGDELTLSSGEVLHLEAIESPQAKDWADKAKQNLEELTATHSLFLEDRITDRYGHIRAQAYAVDATGKKLWLQGEMLKRGLAFVYPPTGNEARLDEMRALESEARKNKSGIWTDALYADTSADNASPLEGRFAFVSGLVLDTARVKNMVYVNFGENWRNDFTVAIAAHDLRAFRRADFDPLALKGKIIRVRGWVKHDFGPMIAATNPAQIEILNAGNGVRR